MRTVNIIKLYSVDVGDPFVDIEVSSVAIVNGGWLRATISEDQDLEGHLLPAEHEVWFPPHAVRCVLLPPALDL